MNKKDLTPQFTWDTETGMATCILTDGKSVYVGSAKCCYKDKDMQNEKTGCEIALMRAEINYFQSIKDNELIPALNVLKGIQFSLNQCETDSKSKSIVQKKIHKIENDLAVVRYLIIEKEQSLTDYIAAKDTFYKQIRKNRKKGKFS